MSPTIPAVEAPHESAAAPSKYRRLFAGQTHGVAYCQIVLDAQGKPADFVYLEVNEAFERIIGLRRSIIEGQRFTDVFPASNGNTADVIADRGQVALTEQESQSDQYFPYLRRWYSVYLFCPQKGFFVSVFTDISERKQAEQEQGHLFNLSLDLLSVASFDGHLERVNPAWTQCLGWSAEELTTRPWLSFVHPDDHALTIQAGSSLIQGGAVRDFENRYLCKDGSYRWLSWNSQAITATGQMFSVARDVTELKRSAQILRDSHSQLRALAARLQNIREEQSAQIAREIHDVLAQELTRLKIDLVWLSKRLPVSTNTAGTAATVTPGEPITEPMRSLLALRIADATQLADTAISSVQKIATELRPVILDSLGLFAAVEWLVEEFAHRVELAWSVNVPSAVGGELALPDRDRSIALFRILQQALTNIARHAQATSVDVRLTQATEGFTLTIKDDGIGITMDQQRNIHSIGLAGMRERALAFNGSVSFEGTLGLGTTVTVRLPEAVSP